MQATRSIIDSDGSDCDDEDDDDDDVSTGRKCVASCGTAEIGLGMFEFKDYFGNVYFALHQNIGKPVGAERLAMFYCNLILFADFIEGLAKLTAFLNRLIEESEKQQAGYFYYYKWNCDYNYWSTIGACKARPLSSVILPEAIKQRLCDDIDSFVSEETQSFYESHGIPYKRSYLFFGVPGAGKTSLIQALAGHYNRSVSYVQASHPDMTDDSLKDSISQLSSDTIVVLEDVDSLFALDRSNKVEKSCLTFSGLLNAIDGVGKANGQIFILTTNLRHELDPALIRSGRVDMHVEFSYLNREQMQLMWNRFYPQHTELSAHFADSLTVALGDRKLAAASLQHFLVLAMRHTAEEALTMINGTIIEDLEIRLSQTKQDANIDDIHTSRSSDACVSHAENVVIGDKTKSLAVKLGDTTVSVRCTDTHINISLE